MLESEGSAIKRGVAQNGQHRPRTKHSSCDLHWVRFAKMPLQAKNAIRNYTPRTSADPRVTAAIARIEALLAAQAANESRQ